MFEQNHSLLSDLKILVEKYPNDNDLGAKVRALIESWEYVPTPTVHSGGCPSCKLDNYCVRQDLGIYETFCSKIQIKE